VPALWDAKMQELLGVDTRGNFKDGPLQDVHWPEGLFGYFPCYSLGAMYAAQWFAAMRRAMPDLDARIARGDLARCFDWLREHLDARPAAGPPTNWRARQRRGAEPGALQGAPAARYLG
jgi:carboxypeptidase Taq